MIVGASEKHAQNEAAQGEPASALCAPVCVEIPEGWFAMGCEAGRDEEKPVHQVWVDRFSMAALQVRNLDYEVFLKHTPHPPPKHWKESPFDDPHQPVVAVSWFDAVAYAHWLSAATGHRYRLPTEAEWERAARGGQEQLLYVWGDAPPNEREEYLRRWGGEVKAPLPVGLAPPNAYGLFDIGENIHEWCADWFHKNYYVQSAVRNPQGPADGDRRASRGGSWRHHVKVSRCAARSSIPPAFMYADYGFRLVREV
ncbi:MAG: SUMF1/EgtB/PvdO family nonheme iron enzyme [Acidobacteriia bacterium]|nr:SUMF1/EgtB/PvdO family nonheme iron enzyme [Terriglobia bacterium]